MASRKQVLAVGGGVTLGYVAGYLTPLGRTAAQIVAACMPVPPPAVHEAAHGDVYVRATTFWMDAHADLDNPPKHGDTYYFVRVLITNRSAATYDYSDGDYTLQTPDGVAYQHTVVITSQTLLPSSGSLAPGQRVAGDLVFDAPAHQRVVLLWTPAFEVANIAISLPRATS